MTTALDIIKRSLRLLGVYAIGEQPSDDEASDGLMVLNALLDGLANDSFLIAVKSQDSIPLTANQASVTVGPSGSFVTTRPVEVLESSYILYQGVSYPLAVLTLQDYTAIPVKTITGVPSAIYPAMGMPNVTITPYMVPSDSMTLVLESNKQITSFSSLTTTLALPPGYERLLAYLLAVDLAPEFEIAPSQAVMTGAASAMKRLKRVNMQIPRLQMPYGLPVGGFRGRIS